MNETTDDGHVPGNSSEISVPTSASMIPGNSTEYPPIPFHDLTIPPCQWILYADINDSGVRVWDLIILVPNSLFLLFLCLRMRPAIAKLKASNSPIFTAFYALVFIVSLVGVVRCIVSMTVNASTAAGDVTDKVLWLLLKFFLLATELSVIIFGLGFGHLDSRTSIRRVLIVTFSFALVYSAIQCILELEYDHPSFTGKSSGKGNSTGDISYDLFAHGGMIFLFSTSIFFFLIYSIITVLPFTRIRERFHLPTKILFYVYCIVLAALNLSQAVASILLYMMNAPSLCVIDVTSYAYFSLYNPLVYGVFLWKFFETAQTGLQFSYKSQDDEVDEDQLSLPYSTAVHKNEDHAPIFSYDSTHFDVQYSRSNSFGSNTTAIPSLSVNSDFNSSANMST
ncbi:transmembrane protein adipocyte-associated 1 homolog [Aplysia californica]|uniref:Transmembrane protein adipocyte-associated 1 homolog n=1 Tax=Aplysia californica TaxID=6500 RepID=A0ABM0JZW9_APLCA|nr:transmembrane protein adipocyte-associated 1 homolog [Aplysia californica]